MKGGNNWYLGPLRPIELLLFYWYNYHYHSIITHCMRHSFKTTNHFFPIPLKTTHSNLVSSLPSLSVWDERGYRPFSFNLLSQGCRWGVCRSWSCSFSAVAEIWTVDLPIALRGLYPLDQGDTIEASLIKIEKYSYSTVCNSWVDFGVCLPCPPGGGDCV